MKRIAKMKKGATRNQAHDNCRAEVRGAAADKGACVVAVIVLFPSQTPSGRPASPKTPGASYRSQDPPCGGPQLKRFKRVYGAFLISALTTVSHLAATNALAAFWASRLGK